MLCKMEIEHVEKYPEDVKRDGEKLPLNSGIRIYRKRWLILFLYVLYSMVSTIQWLEFSIISNLVAKFYEVSEYEVEWTAMINMIVCPFFTFPALWMINRLGNRYCVIFGISMVCLSSWIKIFATSQGSFPFVIASQLFNALNQVLTYGLIGCVPAAWFPNNEVAFAGSLIRLGENVGNGISFMLPSTLVKDGGDIGKEIFQVDLIVVTFTTIVFFLMALFFKAEPNLPPSAARNFQKDENSKISVLQMVNKTLRNKNYLFVMVAFGLNASVYNAFISFLNTIFRMNFPNENAPPGFVGLLTTISSIFGATTSGYFMDRTRMFKETVMMMCFVNFWGIMLYTFSLKYGNVLSVYGAAIIYGYSLSAWSSACSQFSIELTYPMSESICVAFLVVTDKFFALLLSNAFAFSLNAAGDLISNLGLATMSFLSLCIIILVPKEYKRQDAEKRGNTSKIYKPQQQ